MMRVTCFSHAHYRIAETICRKFNNVDELVSNVREIVLKAQSRLAIFRTEASGTSFPSVPITTH